MGKEIAPAHVCNVSARSWTPIPHAMRILAGVIFYRDRRAPIRIAFTKYRVDCGTQNFSVPGLNIFLFFVLRLIRVFRHLIAMLVQLSDSFSKLWNGGADIWQLDDIGLRILSQVTQFG